ncbi:hypothetical protein [Polluticaenibacter yanchengensis]|uniref:DNA recombination protein RmuC n=1 Tax=Polluticaenibacter yanchengensis TaxID=3014562 RepID=A0ABT4UG14_9BACT|nr:hypothetical protein [Chitinophagaceae bacterium LY-5]
MNSFQLNITQVSVGIIIGIILGIAIMYFVNKSFRKKFANDFASLAENLEETELKLNLSDSKIHKVNKENADLEKKFKTVYEEYQLLTQEIQFLISEFDKEKSENARLKALEIELTNELNQMHGKNSDMHKDLIFAMNEKNRLKGEVDMLKK